MRRIEPAYPDLLPVTHLVRPGYLPGPRVALDPIRMGVVWEDSPRRILPAEGSVPRTENIAIDLRVLLVTALVSIAAGILAASIPALKISRFGGGRTLQAGTRSVAAGRPNGLRNAAEAETATAIISG